MKELYKEVEAIDNSLKLDYGIASLAKTLIYNHAIQVNSKRFYLTEIEVYYHSKNHPDVYCHCNDQQLTTLQWYFHGSGIDITIGNAEKKNYGGILIRGIKDEEGNFTSGPLKVAKILFAAIGGVAKQELSFGLVEMPLRDEKVFYGTRIGLNPEKEGGQNFVDKPYRFISDISNTKHGFKDKIAFAKELLATKQATKEELDKIFWKGIAD